SLLVDFDAEKLEAGADAGANVGGVLADATGENDGVESAERGGERADPFLRLVAEHSQSLGGARVGRLALEQVAHVSARLREPEQSRLFARQFVELLGGDP